MKQEFSIGVLGLFYVTTHQKGMCLILFNVFVVLFPNVQTSDSDCISVTVLLQDKIKEVFSFSSCALFSANSWSELTWKTVSACLRPQKQTWPHHHASIPLLNKSIYHFFLSLFCLSCPLSLSLSLYFPFYIHYVAVSRNTFLNSCLKDKCEKIILVKTLKGKKRHVEVMNFFIFYLMN